MVLELRGIPQQSSVGFLTILEALRYCEVTPIIIMLIILILIIMLITTFYDLIIKVGSFLKNPLHPVWLIGSETHLTVLFSTVNHKIN